MRSAVPVFEFENDSDLAWTQVLAVMRYPGIKEGKARETFSFAHRMMKLSELERLRTTRNLSAAEATRFEVSRAAFFRDGGFTTV